MSVQRYETGDGTRWRVRWRESTGRMRSTTVPSKSDAIALDADIKAKKFKGEALPRPSRETLAGAYDEWLRLRADNLAPSSLTVYKSAWNAHVRGTGFDSHRLTDLVADRIPLEELTADLRARGVGPAAQRKAMVVLSAVLTPPCSGRGSPRTPSCECRSRRRPASASRVHSRPLVIERIRLRVLRRRTNPPDEVRVFGDACLVNLMAYAGLRPGEALALRWGDAQRHTMRLTRPWPTA